MTEKNGYSVIELLIATVVLALLLGGLYTVLFQSQAVFEAHQDSMALRQEARVAISQLATELRLAGYGLGNLPEAIPEASTSRLVFVADIDDGSPNAPCGAASETALNGGAERITHQLDANRNLLRTVDCWDGNAWTNEYTNQILAANVYDDEAVFRYLDATGTELVPGGGGLTAAQRAQVRSIVITLLLKDPDTQAVGPSQVQYRISTRLAIRNLGS